MNVLRWILVMPGALLAAILILFPLHWLFLIISSPSPDAFISVKDCSTSFIFCFLEIETVERLGYGFITPLTIIVASSYIAPSKKVRVGKVFAILIALFIFWNIFAEQVYEFQFSYYLILIVLQIAGIYTGLRIIRDKFDPEEG
tara:strand:+ start:649 stop:1080 length:432 start_codon:yes stop_codon:yes gene_type:complete